MTDSKTRRTPAPKLQPARLAFLDGLRAVAAIYVLLHHTFLTVYPQAPAGGLMGQTTNWLENGDYGVTLFIVVSGYSLMLSPLGNGLRLRGGVLTFFRRRFLRIVPAYWAALLLSTILAVTVLSTWTGTHWDVSLPVTWQSVVVHSLLLQDFADAAKINHVFWSVAIEWHIYFLFPLLLVLWRRRSMWWTTAVIVVVSTAVALTVASRLPPYTADPAALLWFNYLGCFTMGAAAARVAKDGGVVSIRGTRRRPNWWLLAALAAVATAVCHHLVYAQALETTLFGVMSALLLIALASGQIAWLRRMLQWKPLVWVGIASYSLYLLHAPIIQLVWQYLLFPLGFDIGEGATFFVLAPISLVLSIAAARASFLLVERPFLPTSTRRAEAEEIAQKR
ncbi:peptidoglycan/LPS O-acetylase OafA/YrhL [Glaciihabitans tibetensis]|uniref:Peptidoglycan/LPS O-acetylase OafA/YrhL n=1 Tax=Glaciihabitans tibetensis TaxID=1266600 RepID=A0A2T0V5D5_9MICO|nr:acyltransferase [Glaciihabitans tibetensis]PRY65386.1 peptidoglycan/LPS O-acetylase OafA/YrhL [Glaciihabitans tibetensis]